MTEFAAVLTRQLKRLGLRGDPATISLSENGLDLHGAKDGSVMIAYSDVIRMRAGFTDGRGSTHYECALQTSSARLVLHRHGAHPNGYRAGVLAIAANVAERRGLQAVERGVSWFGALFGPALMVIPVLGALYVATVLLDHEPWWGRSIVPLVPLIVLALLSGRAISRHVPRSVRSIDELTTQLPRG
jgi:hypothetical protein